MRYIDEYRNKEQALFLVNAIKQTVSRPWHIMEICGGQTHTIARYRLEDMLRPEVRLLHGPGCPVCVTPEQTIDYALELATQPDVILASFGDMMRVPGSREDLDLLTVKAKGADVRMLYSPLDAVILASDNPNKQIVFFAIGFETTTPVHLMALQEAKRRGLKNYHLLTSLFTVPSAINTILADPECKVDGFLLAGHVCAVTGYKQYYPLVKRYRTPMVVTGFEPVDILYGIYKCVCLLEKGKYSVENAYKRAVASDGNLKASALMNEMLEPCDQEWRGIGIIPGSGLRLKKGYQAFSCSQPQQRSIFDSTLPKADFQFKFQVSTKKCIAGDIMRGVKQVADCPHFGTDCTPSRPLGAPMVSTEGVCAAYYKYQ